MAMMRAAAVQTAMKKHVAEKTASDDPNAQEVLQRKEAAEELYMKLRVMEHWSPLFNGTELRHADGEDIPSKMQWAMRKRALQAATYPLFRVWGSADTTWLQYLQNISEDTGYPKHWITLQSVGKCRKVGKF